MEGGVRVLEYPRGVRCAKVLRIAFAAVKGIAAGSGGRSPSPELRQWVCGKVAGGVKQEEHEGK